MRTKISKLLLAVGCTASLMLPTSCIEETFPTDRATADQISKSPKHSLTTSMCLVLKSTMIGVMAL